MSLDLNIHVIINSASQYNQIKRGINKSVYFSDVLPLLKWIAFGWRKSRTDKFIRHVPLRKYPGQRSVYEEFSELRLCTGKLSEKIFDPILFLLLTGIKLLWWSEEDRSNQNPKSSFSFFSRGMIFSFILREIFYLKKRNQQMDKAASPVWPKENHVSIV